MECFTVYADDLKGILSPLFFISQPENTKGFIELNKIAEINLSRKINNLDLNDLVPYVGLPETDNLEIKEVLKRPYKEVRGRNIIKKGDILFARIEPSIFNKKYILADDLRGNDYAFTSTEFYIVKAKENINPKFLFYMFFTKQVYVQVLGRTTGSTGRRRLDRGVFENLLIPFPDKQIQNKIVQLMDKSYSLKKSREAEAQQLLDSINDYVLDELGMKFSSIEEDKIYCIDSEELENSRSDPYYFNPKFKRLLADLQKSKITLAKLKDVAEDIFNGKTPAKEDYAEEGNLILKVSCLKHNKIKWDNLSYFKEGVPAIKTIKDKDVLLLSSAHQGEYLGKNPSIVEMPTNFKEKNIYFVGELINIRADKEKVNPYYILAILKLNEYYLFVNREKRGQTSHLYPEDLGNVKIPLPPLAVQNKIAEEVKKRMWKAEQLQKEAKEELEKAKKAVEKIILGE